MCDSTHARVLSEGPRSQGETELADATHALAARMTRPRATSRASSTASPTGSDRARRPADLAHRQVRPWRRPYSFSRARLSRRAGHRRDRELQLAAPGFEDRERDQIWRHDRPCRFPLSRQDDQAERRRACSHRQRAAAASAESGRRGEHGYDADVADREDAADYVSAGAAPMRASGNFQSWVATDALHSARGAKLDADPRWTVGRTMCPPAHPRR